MLQVKDAFTHWKNAHKVEKLIESSCQKRITGVIRDTFIALRMHALEVRKDRYRERALVRKVTYKSYLYQKLNPNKIYYPN